MTQAIPLFYLAEKHIGQQAYFVDSSKNVLRIAYRYTRVKGKDMIILSINRIRTTPTPKVSQEKASPNVTPITNSEASISVPNIVPTRETKKNAIHM